MHRKNRRPLGAMEIGEEVSSFYNIHITVIMVRFSAQIIINFEIVVFDILFYLPLF